MVSMVTPTFKYFIKPVSPEIIAKHTDQDINSLIFSFLMSFAGFGTMGNEESNP